MSIAADWLDLHQVEARLCVLTAEQLGLDLDEVKSESRLIEALNCDSLDMIELIMETEDEFGVTIPDTPTSPVGKLIFTRQRRPNGNTPPKDRLMTRNASMREFTDAARPTDRKACQCRWCNNRTENHDSV